MFKMAVPFAGTFTFEGIVTNSKGLDEIEGFLSSPLLPDELARYNDGPQITADYFAKVKSMSRS